MAEEKDKKVTAEGPHGDKALTELDFVKIALNADFFERLFN